MEGSGGAVPVGEEQHGAQRRHSGVEQTHCRRRYDETRYAGAYALTVSDSLRTARRLDGASTLVFSLAPTEAKPGPRQPAKDTTKKADSTAKKPAATGNVGTAVASLVGEVDPATTIVCECSSFQLEDTIEFAPEAAVLLNLRPDHLDRHGTFEAYVEAKRGAFRRQGPEAIAVMASDEGVEMGGAARMVTFGAEPDVPSDLKLRYPWLRWRGKRFMRLDEIGIPGAHNQENAMAVAAVTLARGVAPDAVREGLRTFAGVPHRLEPIAERRGVLYVNDSKATNVDSTLVALRAQSFRSPSVHLIAGGHTKAQDFSPLVELVRERCLSVRLIGEGAGEIAAALAPAGVPLIFAEEMERAVSGASAAARPGHVVLLSPACASFDQYPDFEARGEHFRALVEAL